MCACNHSNVGTKIVCCDLRAVNLTPASLNGCVSKEYPESYRTRLPVSSSGLRDLGMPVHTYMGTLFGGGQTSHSTHYTHLYHMCISHTYAIYTHKDIDTNKNKIPILKTQAKMKIIQKPKQVK